MATPSLPSPRCLYNENSFNALKCQVIQVGVPKKMGYHSLSPLIREHFKNDIFSFCHLYHPGLSRMSRLQYGTVLPGFFSTCSWVFCSRMGRAGTGSCTWSRSGPAGTESCTWSRSGPAGTGSCASSLGSSSSPASRRSSSFCATRDLHINHYCALCE